MTDTPEIATRHPATTTSELIEAKSSADRWSVRVALGHLLDYGRFVDHQALAVLLPEKPVTDLCELLASFNISIISRQHGSFRRITPDVNPPDFRVTP